MRLLSMRSTLIERQDQETFWRNLVSLWDELRGEDRAMPARSDFTPERFRSYLGRLCFIEVSYDGDGQAAFVYRVAGTHVAEQTGLEMTGKDLSNISPKMYREGVRADFMEVVDKKIPILKEIILVSDEEKVSYQRMTLPFSDDGTQVTYLLTCAKGIKPIADFLEKLHLSEA